MNKIDKQNLIEGEYYSSYNRNIFKWGENCSTNYLGNKCNEYNKGNGGFFGAERLATPEEKHWLGVCIIANKFISKKEALKSFIPEYVKCNNNGGSHSNNFTINKIYKVIKEDNNKYLHLIGDNNNTVTVFKGLNHPNKSIKATYFTLSTKEEYDAQFKEHIIKTVTTTIDKFTYGGSLETPKGTTFEVTREFENSYQVINPNSTSSHSYFDGDKYLFLHKCYFEPQEPEFVLPEKWCIKGNDTVRQYFERNKNGWIYTHLHNYYHSENLIPSTGWKMNTYKDKDHTEITFEQFKKYVLKEGEPAREVIVKLDSRVYSLDEISKALTKEYDKVDVEDILKIIKTIK